MKQREISAASGVDIVPSQGVLPEQDLYERVEWLDVISFDMLNDAHTSNNGDDVVILGYVPKNGEKGTSVECLLHVDEITESGNLSVF